MLINFYHVFLQGLSGFARIQKHVRMHANANCEGRNVSLIYGRSKSLRIYFILKKSFKMI